MKPTVIVPYSLAWPELFLTLKAELHVVFGPQHVEVEHVGSTSVPDLCAKPVIDVLLGAENLTVFEMKIADMERCGFEYVSKYELEIPQRRYFVRSLPGSLRVHVHGVVRGGELWQDHLEFRNLLRTDKSLMLEYAELKLSLARQFADNKSAYSVAKGPFIRSAIKKSRSSGVVG